MNLISFTVSYIYTILQEIYIQLSLDLKFNVMLNKLKKISALRAQLKQCSKKIPALRQLNTMSNNFGGAQQTDLN